MPYCESNEEIKDACEAVTEGDERDLCWFSLSMP